MTAFTTALLSWSRLLISTKKDDFPFLIGPEKLPPKNLVWLGARLIANGFREFRLSSLKLKKALPRYLSEPGFVRISIRPKPRRSNSAENGLLLIRISRIASLGGRLPPVKPSM